MPNPTLTPEAALLLQRATEVLATIGLTPARLTSLLLAKDMSEDFADPEAWTEGASVPELVAEWCSEANEMMRDDLFDAATFLTT